MKLLLLFFVRSPPTPLPVVGDLCLCIATVAVQRRQVTAQHKREERLMMSAFYEIGLDMQRRVLLPKTK